MIRRIGLAALLLVFGAFAASAGEMKPYSPATFIKSLASGKTIVVHVQADACAACKKQQPILKSLSEEKDLAKVEFVRVNFEKDEEFLVVHRVSSQSVILVFKDGKEVERLKDTTDAAEITSKIKAAVG
jgi:thiol-disulfide isomerase/thioredoxin